MPVYNGEKYLDQAIQSLLNQTFRDFTLIAINDGSSDNSLHILRRYEEFDNRVLVLNQSNSGVAETLNRGLNIATGKYIARMDCDDVSLPLRFEKQFNFMETNPEVAICGTWVKTLGEAKQRIWNPPTRHEEITFYNLFESAILHPTIIMRRKSIIENNLFYDPTYIHAEDYELWVRASKVVNLANISEVLLLYRLHSNQIGKKYFQEQQNTVMKLHQIQLQNLGITATSEELLLHEVISDNSFKVTSDFVTKSETWFKKIIEANAKLAYYKEPDFSSYLSRRWYSLCKRSTILGPKVCLTFFRSEFGKLAGATIPGKLKFAIKCLLKF